MTRFAPQWLQQGVYAASVDRRLMGALWPTPATAGCAVTVSSGMTVNIAAGQVAVPTANNTGTVLCSFDATEQVTLAAAPASGSNRIDLIICQVRGNDIDGGANNDFLFTNVTGTAAASPAVPAVPNNAVALAQVYVPGASASVTAGNITDRRPGALSVPVYQGAIFATTAARDAAWPNPPNGATCVTTDTGTQWQRIAGTWYTPGGVLGNVERPSAAGPAVAEAIFLSTPAFTLPTARRVRCEGGFRGLVFVAGSTATFMRLRDGTTTAGASIFEIQVIPPPSNAGDGHTFGRTVTLNAGSHQVSMSLESLGGAGNTVQGASTYPIWIEARDVGPP